MSLARRVRDCRFAKGWGPDELSNRAAISRTALYQIESGKTELPRAATLRRIAQALDVSMDVLLDDIAAPDLIAAEARPQPEAVRALALRREGDREEIAASPRGRAYHSLPGSIALGTHGTRYAPAVATVNDPAAAADDLVRKFQAVLDSPLGESIARLVEDSHRLLLMHA